VEILRRIELPRATRYVSTPRYHREVVLQEVIGLRDSDDCIYRIVPARQRQVHEARARQVADKASTCAPAIDANSSDSGIDMLGAGRYCRRKGWRRPAGSSAPPTPRASSPRIGSPNDTDDTRPTWAIFLPTTGGFREAGWCYLERNVSDRLSLAKQRLGYLLLRDGHAVPLKGIAPDEIKAGAKHHVPNPDSEPLQHRRCLNAIVDRLGFPGDFGDFQNQGWPDFKKFLERNRCTHEVGVFPVDHGGCIDLYFSNIGGPSPRQLADRIFEAMGPKPERVFLGYDVDWAAWDRGNGIAYFG
jgi:hypothetical protein